MRFSSPVRTDLVISMTLAETFLLLLFVVWYGHTPHIGTDSLAVLKDQLARFEHENARLHTELTKANEQIANLEFRLELWRQATGLPEPPATRGALAKAICRSNPQCEESNVLVHTTVVRRQMSMEWLMESPRFSKWLKDHGRPYPPIGDRITDMKTIQALLAAVREYYSSPDAKMGETECRFDYRLTYGSKEDYYDGRMLFERYFYPAGLSRTGTGSP
jgi:hypothetical protein